MTKDAADLTGLLQAWGRRDARALEQLAPGKYPRWRGDGKALLFVSPAGTMMAAGFGPTNGVPQGVPQPLFATQIRVGDSRPYAVDKSGQRFLLKVGPEPQMVAS